MLGWGFSSLEVGVGVVYNKFTNWKVNKLCCFSYTQPTQTSVALAKLSFPNRTNDVAIVLLLYMWWGWNLFSVASLLCQSKFLDNIFSATSSMPKPLLYWLHFYFSPLFSFFYIMTLCERRSNEQLLMLKKYYIFIYVLYWHNKKSWQQPTGGKIRFAPLH